MQDGRLELAGRFIRAGKPAEARPILEQILKDNRNLIPAWQLYADTWPNAADKERVWGYCLRFNPGNRQAQEALAALKAGVIQSPQIPTQSFKDRQPPAGPRGTRSGLWPLLGGLGLFSALVLGMVFLIMSFYPKDPAQYRHEQPVEYYLYVPRGYTNEREWPLFVGIHGSGGSGLECWRLWQSYADKEGFILLCPTIPGDSGGYWQDVGERTVWSAVMEVQKEYRISPRMFLAGFSAGGFFIQGFAYHYPNAVSGLAILSSTYVLMDLQPRAPVLVVIGGSDLPGAVGANEEFVRYLNQNGFDAEYEELPGVGHRVTNQGKTLTIELFRKTVGK
jgi:alpha/beta superfamily hydrolase